MKKVIIGSVMFLAGLLSAAVLLAGTMAHDRTTTDGDLSSFRNLTQYGLLSAFYTFIGTAIIGLVVVDDCETISASDGTGQYIQKRAPMQWQVALILYILSTPCSRKEAFRKRLGLVVAL